MKPSATTVPAVILAAFAVAAPVRGAEVVVKVLPTPEDPAQKVVLVGRNLAGDMLVTLELERAKAMWMKTNGNWAEHPAGGDRDFHVEVKAEDPKSKTRIPDAEVGFTAVNRDNGKKVSAALHPMWSGNGLHYANNSPLAGDGTYEATVTVGVPGFARALTDKTLWMSPVETSFHFRLAGGKLVEVSVPAPPAR